MLPLNLLLCDSGPMLLKEFRFVYVCVCVCFLLQQLSVNGIHCYTKHEYQMKFCDLYVFLFFFSFFFFWGGGGYLKVHTVEYFYRYLN